MPVNQVAKAEKSQKALQETRCKGLAKSIQLANVDRDLSVSRFLLIYCSCLLVPNNHQGGPYFISF